MESYNQLCGGYVHNPSPTAPYQPFIRGPTLLFFCAFKTYLLYSTSCDLSNEKALVICCILWDCTTCTTQLYMDL